MPFDLTPEIEQRLRDEKTVWLATVSADGQPMPVPVWYWWDGHTFLIYSQPKAHKVRNIEANPKVAIIFAHTDEYGEEDGITIWGDAAFDSAAPPSNQLAAYIEKYRQGIADINMTPESLAADFSLPIRITPTHMRGA